MTLRNTLSPYLKPVRHRTHLQYLFCFVLISFLAAFFPATDAFAQTARVTVGTASGLPGTTVNVSVGFTAGATPVSMLQFDLLYSAPLSYSSVATGQAAANAGKSAVGNQIAGGSRIVVFGLNQTGIGSGSVAVVQFNIAGVAPAGPATIAITGLVASDPNANPVQVSGVNGAVTVLPPPDTTPPVISGVSSSNITSNSARITWTTNEASDTQVEYGKTTSYGSSTTLNGSMVTSHSHTLSGLSANTTYHYRVKSKDAAGNLATSPDYTFKTAAAPDTTAPVISGVSSSNVTSNSARITWTTNEASDTQVEYGKTTSYGSSTTLNGSMVTSHSQTLSGLSANTTYHYRVKSKDAAGNLATSPDYTFKTAAAPDTTPPVISGVSSSNITSNSARITWTTNEASDTQVEYGKTTSYGSSTTLNGSMVTSHSQMLSGLSANTTYHYRVKSKDAAGNLATSPDYTFKTAAAPDTTPPVISGVSSSNITSNSARITWTTNEASDTQVEYGKTTSYGSSTTLNGSMVTSHSQMLSGLSANTTYHYRVKSKDAAGNLATSPDYTFKTAAAPDTTPPVISGVSSSNITSNSARITWTTNEASDTQVEYGKTTSYGSSTTLNGSMVTSHSQTLSGLSANTTYHYRVKSKDAAGNLATSPDYTFKTAAAPDTTAPVISGVTSSQITAFGATISWTTDEAANSRVEYGTTTTHGNSTALDGAMKTAHSQQLSDLLPNTRYHFRVRSADAAGNESVSADFTFMTAPPPDTTPPSINAVTASEITTSGATISWTTNEAATTQVEYGTTTSYGSKTTLISALTTAHSQALSGLTAGTTYHYRVLSLDGSGNAAVSGDFTFKTLEDKTAPVISNVSTSNANDAGVTITWTTDEPADSEVEYGASEAYGSSTPVNGVLTTAHSVTLSGLSAGKTYHFRVKSRDSAGNAAVSTDYTFNTSDGIGPVITGVSTSNLTVDSITISWMTNEPADTQIEYGAVPKIVKTDSGKQSDKGSKRPTLRNFWQRLLEQLQEKIDRSHPPVYNRSTEVNPSMALTHSQTLTGLSHDTTYHFRVKSRDAAGNLTISQDFVFKTAEKGSAPVIANVSITDLTDRSATISWTTDKPADSQLEYRGKNVEPAKSALGGLVTEHSLTLNNLQKSTLYTFILKAADSDGNEGVSSEFTFTTAETGTASVALPRFTGASIRTVQGTASDVMLGMSLANLSSSAEAVALTAIDSSGNPISGTDIVNPKTENLNSGAQSSIIDRTAFGPGFANSPAEGWIKLESTSSDVDGFFLTFDGSLGFMDGAGLGSAPLKHFAFTGIEPAGTRVSISNPNPEAATVTFSLVKADGTIRGSRSQTIAAEGSLAAGLSDLFGGITPDATDYLSATSTQGVQPFALLQKGEGDVAILAGQDVTAGRTVLYSPQYIVDELWSTSLSVVNLDSRPGMVMFRYIGDDGVQIGETRAAAIPAYGKFQIDDPSFFTELEAGMTVNGYLEIVSDGIRISGSTTFGDRNGTTFATAMPLAQRLGTSALFSHVASSDLYFTQLSVVNPNHGDANVTIELHGADGTLVDSRTIVVPAGERSSGLLTQYFPSLEGSNQSSGYMRVISDIPVTSFSLVGTNDLSVLSAIPPQ